ncbi:hypothetical protein ABPG75_007364 [Micractinium tetrahymenae]
MQALSSRLGLAPFKSVHPIAARQPLRTARIAATAAPPCTATNGSGVGSSATAAAMKLQTVVVTEPITVAGPVQIVGVLPRAAVYQAAANAGAAKAAMPFGKTVLLGVVAGAAHDWWALAEWRKPSCRDEEGAAQGALQSMDRTAAAWACCPVGPNCPGIAQSNPGLAKYITAAIGFLFVLLMILVCGAELFTGNTALLPAAVYEGKATMGQLAKNWVGSYLGNALGCALGCFLLLNCGLMPQFANAIKAISVAKVSYPFKESFLKAVMAN